MRRYESRKDVGPCASFVKDFIFSLVIDCTCTFRHFLSLHLPQLIFLYRHGNNSVSMNSFGHNNRVVKI